MSQFSLRLRLLIALIAFCLGSCAKDEDAAPSSQNSHRYSSRHTGANPSNLANCVNETQCTVRYRTTKQVPSPNPASESVEQMREMRLAASANSQEAVQAVAENSERISNRQRADLRVSANETDAPSQSQDQRCDSAQNVGQDSDLARNCAEIKGNNLRIDPIEFDEGGLHWLLYKVTREDKLDGPLWFVPHDDENVAFNTAIYGVAKHGGTVIAVKTGGSRCNYPQGQRRPSNPHSACSSGAQDPNRNFQFPGTKKCREQIAASPLYTQKVLENWNKSYPIIALHSNRPGGVISIERYNIGNPSLFRGDRSSGDQKMRPLFQLFRPVNTLVFLSSAQHSSPRTQKFKDGLVSNGVNVIWEHVDTSNNDCSLSNYAALAGIDNYFNVEVGDSEEKNSESAQAQKKIVDLIVELPGVRS